MTPPTVDLPDLPVREALPALRRALDGKGAAVLIAPPGAGKTTLVPLDLLDAPWRGDGRIIVLEPRRLAARAAARRMAQLSATRLGGLVGLRMRLDNQVSAATRIEVVTEGVFVRMALDDPELDGVAAVLFDEFHERSLDADFGLALALDIRSGLRPDLRLLVMSATIDGARVASLLGDAPVVESAGRAFPVDIRHRPRDPALRLEDAVANAIRDAVADETGSILAFLPGQGEIVRVAERLDGRLPADCIVAPLFGQMDLVGQDLAIQPPPAGKRKMVLATSIAETSITIEGVRIVIDSGYARVPRFEAASGLTRLETVRVSRASADQRAGRAGRTQPGIAIRLWQKEQTAVLPAYATPEIFETDLSRLLLDCIAFGVADPGMLPFPDRPPAAALAEARALLKQLGAVDGDMRLTATGAAIRSLPLPVRLAAMVAAATNAQDARQRAEIAVVLSEQGLGGNHVDIEQRLAGFRRDRGDRADKARALARRLAEATGATAAGAAAAVAVSLADAFPDRVAMARGPAGRFVMANGRGASLDETAPLAGCRFLVIADVTGSAQAGRIRAAAELADADLRAHLADRIDTREAVQYDPRAGAVRGRRTTRLGAIVLDESPMPVAPGPLTADAIAEALAGPGFAQLAWPRAAQELRLRLGYLHKTLGQPWPDMSDAALAADPAAWLMPFAPAAASLADAAAALLPALQSLVPQPDGRDLDRLAPTHFDAPSGSRVPIRYEETGPVLPVRVQELFGLTVHPTIAGGRVPLTLELLSPAHRPIQTTADLPGFWAGSWADVRADMRGRYPRHVWPEDPAHAQATSRAKPRG